MEKYMVIYREDGETYTVFTEDYSKAENCRMNAECGLGVYAEVYERINGEYVFLYA